MLASRRSADEMCIAVAVRGRDVGLVQEDGVS